MFGSPELPPLAADVVVVVEPGANAPPAAIPPSDPAPPAAPVDPPLALLSLNADSNEDALLLPAPPTAEEPEVPPLPLDDEVTAGSEKPALLVPLVLLPLYAIPLCS